MTKRQEMYAKYLRRKIMANVITVKVWTSDEFHEYLQEWGYPESLREMTIAQLKEVMSILAGETIATSQAPRNDKKGKYLKFNWHANVVYAKAVACGWNLERINKYIEKHFKKGHLNLLTIKELNSMKAMFNSYLKKTKKEKENEE